MATYKAKPDYVLVIPLIIILGVFGFIMAYYKVWPGLLVMILIALFVAHTFLATFYRIEGRTLKIKSGFLFNKIINIDSIRKIKTTGESRHSSASARKLEIDFNKSDTIIIFPNDKIALLKELREIKPEIEFDLE